jgi:hypothetical protein
MYVNGRKFDNLPQRMISYFIETYAPYYEVKSDKADKKQQKAAHGFIDDIYKKLYDDPTILGLKLDPDDCFRWGQPQKEKNDLAPRMRLITKKVIQLIEVIQTALLQGRMEGDTLLIASGDLEIKPTFLKQMTIVGLTSCKTETGYRIEAPTDTLNGLKLLAEISAQNKVNPVYYFSAGVFNPESPYMVDIYRELSGDKTAYDKLIEYFESNHYTRVSAREGKPNLDYVKNYGKGNEPLKGNWSGKTFGGIEFTWSDITGDQVMIGLRVPFYTELLNRLDLAGYETAVFLLHRTKQCDNCGYCTQTDRTGKRNKLAIAITDQQNVTRNFCPLYPGFMLKWSCLDHQLVDNFIKVMQFEERAFREREVAVNIS